MVFLVVRSCAAHCASTNLIPLASQSFCMVSSHLCASPASASIDASVHGNVWETILLHSCNLPKVSEPSDIHYPLFYDVYSYLDNFFAILVSVSVSSRDTRNTSQTAHLETLCLLFGSSASVSASVSVVIVYCE